MTHIYGSITNVPETCLCMSFAGAAMKAFFFSHIRMWLLAIKLHHVY